MYQKTKILELFTALFALLLIVPAGDSLSAQPDPSPAPRVNFKVSVTGTAPGSVPHDLSLKVTQIPGGQLSETTGFALNPESVVQVKQGENIIVTTSENLKVNNVKAKNVQGQQVDLLPLPNSLWSLQNLVPGVYLLDVTVDMSSSGILGVYETVLVILQPGQQPLPPTTVINEVSIIIEDGPPSPPTNVTSPPPEPPTPCPPDVQVNGVCPPTDDPTPMPEPPTPCPPDVQVNGVCPPTDDPTPVPEPPTPVEDIPTLPEEPPGDNGEDDNGEGDGTGNGEDGSNGNGGDGEEDAGTVPPFG
jgi:hypothetical protein